MLKCPSLVTESVFSLRVYMSFLKVEYTRAKCCTSKGGCALHSAGDFQETRIN